jgi:hypothetical protein
MPRRRDAARLPVLQVLQNQRRSEQHIEVTFDDRQ